MSNISYAYKSNTNIYFAVGSFFEVLCFIFIFLGITNTKGLIISNLIELTVKETSILYYALGGFSTTLGTIGYLIFAKSMKLEKEIVISERSISLPKNALSSDILEIPFSEIANITVQTVHDQTFVTIFHLNKKIIIYKRMLPNEGDFDNLVTIMSQKIVRT